LEEKAKGLVNQTTLASIKTVYPRLMARFRCTELMLLAVPIQIHKEKQINAKKFYCW